MSTDRTTLAAKPVKRPKWLMDPENPIRMEASTDRSLAHVRMWVMSTLVVVTTTHLSLGVVIAAVVIDPTYVSARVGLSIIAMLLGMLGMAMGFAIHRQRPLNAWTWLGLVPGLVGLVWVLR